MDVLFGVGVVVLFKVQIGTFGGALCILLLFVVGVE